MGEKDGATFVKRATRGDNLPGEAAALAWLAEAGPAGGIRVARVLRVSATELVEERVATGAPTAAAARRVGAALARTHAVGAPWYGCPPAGWTGDPWHPLGRTPYVTDAADAPASWGAFFAEHRIMHYVRVLVDEGTFDAGAAALLGRVAARLVDGAFDALQPALVRASGAPCARLHGDLWSGNLLWDANTAAPTGGVLIDPMAYGGHAETDLAMLALFGCPYLDEIVRGYDEASPLADGWRERVGLHQLAPLLLHCVLFGGAYVPQTLAAARRYA